MSLLFRSPPSQSTQFLILDHSFSQFWFPFFKNKTRESDETVLKLIKSEAARGTELDEANVGVGGDGDDDCVGRKLVPTSEASAV